MATPTIFDQLSQVQISYFLLFFTTWLTSQTIKYGLSLLKRKRSTFKHFAQTCLYSSGIPSTHTALLVATLLYMIGREGVSNPLTYIIVLFGIMWIYEIFLQRKRFLVLATLLKIPEEKQNDLLLLKDLHGHDFLDIFVGMFVGSGVYLAFWLFNI